MAFVNETTLLAYDKGTTATTPSHSATMTIDAAGEMVGMIGSIWHPTIKTGTINIRKVHFRCGTVTLNAASQVRVSLQNVSLTAGPPYQPDGVQDQFYDFKTGTTALTANAWNITGNLSADRTVDLSADSLGDANSRWVAVVVEFNVFTAADVVIVSTFPDAVGIVGAGLGGNTLLKTGGVWAVTANRLNCVALECDDGTFAFLTGAAPIATFATANVSSTGAIRRAGILFKVPTTRKLDRAGLVVNIPNGCDGSLVLYDTDGTTVLASVDVDNDAVFAATAVLGLEVAFQPVTLRAETYYFFAFVGGTSTNAVVPYCDFNSVGLMDGSLLGRNAFWVQHNGTSWASTATRRPQFALGFCAFENGVQPQYALGV